MRSIVFVAACLACTCHAHRMQRAEQIKENGDAPSLKRLATLLLASNLFQPKFGTSGSQAPEKLSQKRGGAIAGKREIDNAWALGDEKGRFLADPIAGTHSQAEVEFSAKQKKMAESQEMYSHTWGLGDEKGRQWAGPKAGTHSQAEVEFKQKQDKWRKSAGRGGVVGRRGGSSAKKQGYDNAWALGYENGRTYDGPVAGTHSQAEVEFAQKQDKWRRR